MELVQQQQSKASWYTSSMVSILVRVVLVQREHVIYTRSCSSAMRGPCFFLVLVWLCGQRADDALPSLVGRMLLLLCRPESMLLYTCVVGTALYGQRADALSSRVRTLLCTCGVGTEVWCLYLLLQDLLMVLKACSFALVVFVGTAK